MTNEELPSQYLGKALQAATINNRSFASVVLTAFVFALFAVPSAFAAGASQIVLSCTTPPPQSNNSNGCSSSELVTTPPIINGETLEIVAGFWVWRQNPNGGTPYGPNCAGSMYVEEVNLATGAGHYDATSVSGNSSATGSTGLQVTFTSSDGDVTCTLDVPSSPTKGPTNQLGGICNRIPITFSHAVAQVTSGGA
jgi:hypothetical protein